MQIGQKNTSVGLPWINGKPGGVSVDGTQDNIWNKCQYLGWCHKCSYLHFHLGNAFSSTRQRPGTSMDTRWYLLLYLFVFFRWPFDVQHMKRSVYLQRAFWLLKFVTFSGNFNCNVCLIVYSVITSITTLTLANKYL